MSDSSAIPDLPPIPADGARPRDAMGGSWGWFPWLMLLSALLAGTSLAWRFGAFGDMTPHNASAAVTPSLASVYDLKTPRWPSVFAALPDKSSSVRCGPFTGDTLDDMSSTYGFYITQNHTIEVMAAQFPNLRPQLLAAQAQFDRKFQRTFENIDGFLSQNLKDWSRLRKQLEKVLATQAPPKQTPADAQAFLDEMRQRISGKFPSPQMETLLAFVPAYVADPQREFLDGQQQEWWTDGSGKAHGVEFHLHCPKSWVGADSKQPLVIRTFSDRRRAGTTASVIIGSNAASTISQEDLPILLGPDDVRRTCPDGKLLDAGQINLAANHTAVWREFRGTGTFHDATYRMRFVDFSLVSHGQRVTLQFTVAADPNTAESDLDTAYARNAPLFKLIANSIDVH